MTYEITGVKKEVYPILHQYETLGGAYTKEGREYSRKFLEGILSEVNKISEIERERKERYGNSENIHCL
jgi:hypothetical protein